MTRQNLKKLNKKKPVKKPDRNVEAVNEMLTSSEKMNEATIEVLKTMQAPNVSVEFDSKAIGREIGKAVSEQIAAIPAPIVNIPERRPVSYTASFERNSRGDMIAARIDPINGD